MNYRMKTYFSELNNSNIRDVAVQRIHELDQLYEAFSEGFYPGYVE